MEIPYTVRPRPDTGLANPKLGIWLFLASEVMLFGGLFAGYIFMRLGAEPWMWPKGWLNVPVGTFNTFVLILSSVTVILAWESLKMRNLKAYKGWLGLTIICGFLFLGIKLAFEWPAKFHHFGAYVQKTAAHKYEAALGNEDRLVNGETVKGHVNRKKDIVHPEGYPRLFIGGHLMDNDPHALKASSVPYVAEAKLDAVIALGKDEKDPAKKAKALHVREEMLTAIAVRPADIATLKAEPLDPAKKKEILTRMNTIQFHALDEANGRPYDPANDAPKFELKPKFVDSHLVLNKEDLVAGHGPLVPKLNTYLACYFMITGLHGAHVLAGCLCFLYFLLPIKGGSKLFYTNPEQLCNRIEVSGLFWHLVDLVWIFVFPIFYLL